MNIAEKVAYYREKGCNCCQCALSVLGDYTGLDDLTAAKVGSGFGGGMFCGSICGAVTGGMMAIGAACMTGEDPAAEKQKMKPLCEELQKRFRDEYGTMLCEDILREHDHDLCNTCILFAAAAAEGIIQKYKSDTTGESN